MRRSALLADRPVIALPDTAGLVGYWDARRILGLQDGGSVSQWDDLSGGGFHMAQGTGSKQPRWLMSGINGVPAVDFDGTDDLLVYAGNLSTSVSGTLLMVWQTDVLGVANQTIFGSGDEGSTTRFLRVRQTTGGAESISQRDAEASADTVDGSLIMAATQAHIFALTADDTAYVMRVNGLTDATLTVASGANAGDWLGGTSARDNVTLGASKIQASETGFSNGKLGCVLLYDGAKTAAQLQVLERWLAQVWKVRVP